MHEPLLDPQTQAEWSDHHVPIASDDQQHHKSEEQQPQPQFSPEPGVEVEPCCCPPHGCFPCNEPQEAGRASEDLVAGPGGGGDEPYPPVANSTKPSMVGVSFLTLVVASSMEFLLRKILASNLYNYRWFLCELVSMCTFVISLCLLLISRRVNGAAKREHKMRTPVRAIVIISFLEAVSTLCLLLPVGIIPASGGVLAAQIMIPLSGLLRMAIVEQRFRLIELVSFLLVTGGVIWALLPDYLQSNAPLTDAPEPQSEAASAPSSSRHFASDQLTANAVLLVLSAVPAASAHVYKRRYFETHAVDVLVLNAWSGAIQSIFLLLMAPLALDLQYISAPSSLLPSSQNIFTNFARGMQCMFGHSDFDPPDRCHSNRLWLGFAFGFYLLSMLVIQPAIVQISLFMPKKTSGRPAYSSPSSSSSSAVGPDEGADADATTTPHQQQQPQSNIAVVSTVSSVSSFAPTPSLQQYDVIPLRARGPENQQQQQRRAAAMGSAPPSGSVSIAMLQWVWNRVGLVALALVISTVIAFSLFFTTPIQSMMPAWDGYPTVKLTGYLIGGAVSVVCGLLLSTAQQKQKVEQIDVWAAFEELEDRDASRQAQSERRRKQESAALLRGEPRLHARGSIQDAPLAGL